MNPLNFPVPAIQAPLDPHFRPAILARRAFQQAIGPTAPRLEFALERGPKEVSRFSMPHAPRGHALESANFLHVERLLKFLLWSRGGGRVYFAGPPNLGEQLRGHYRTSPTGKFDAMIMGEKVYDRPFEITLVQAKDLPPANDGTAPLGRHWNGCRIGFDLGASDRKVAAVSEGKVVFTEEVPWDPRAESNPQWHFDQIMDSLKRAAAHLPRVDAIGGSSAGIYVNNRVQVASLFRGVPDDLFRTRIKNLFIELKKAWGGIPFEVVNDGEVTALAGSMSLNDNAVLGIALGSSQAAGYVTRNGNITSWLNELAFVPVDYNPAAPVDEWSGDYGCGVQYFSQQAVGRLIAVAGLDCGESDVHSVSFFLPSHRPPAIDRALPLPEQLVAVQQFMAKGDDRAKAIYETIGIYLGYTIPHYADFYDFRHLLLLGRVTTGPGGAVIVDNAEKVLRAEFPELAARIKIHLPDEKEKRHGQAVAAASLPELKS
jgi:predicted NBD/HSP70 family sugar kinase